MHVLPTCLQIEVLIASGCCDGRDSSEFTPTVSNGCCYSCAPPALASFCGQLGNSTWEHMGHLSTHRHRVLKCIHVSLLVHRMHTWGKSVYFTCALRKKWRRQQVSRQASSKQVPCFTTPVSLPKILSGSCCLSVTRLPSFFLHDIQGCDNRLRGLPRWQTRPDAGPFCQQHIVSVPQIALPHPPPSSMISGWSPLPYA